MAPGRRRDPGGGGGGLAVAFIVDGGGGGGGGGGAFLPALPRLRPDGAFAPAFALGLGGGGGGGGGAAGAATGAGAATFGVTTTAASSSSASIAARKVSCPQCGQFTIMPAASAGNEILPPQELHGHLASLLIANRPEPGPKWKRGKVSIPPAAVQGYCGPRQRPAAPD